VTTQAASPDDFDVAKSIFDQLKDLPPERRDRVLRWVAEGLGTALAAGQLSGHATASSPGHLQQGAATTAAHAPAPATNIDIKTFIASKAPKSDTQFAAAVAYYYRFEAPPAQRRETIDGAALQEAARLAGRSRVLNPRFTLNNAKAAGYLDGDASSGFSVNSVGENLVAMTLPGGGERGAPGGRKAKKGKAKANRAAKRR
jgi:hypothetical protein